MCPEGLGFLNVLLICDGIDGTEDGQTYNETINRLVSILAFRRSLAMIHQSISDRSIWNGGVVAVVKRYRNITLMEEGLSYCPSEMKHIHLLCGSESLLHYCDRDSIVLLHPTDPLQSQFPSIDYLTE